MDKTEKKNMQILACKVRMGAIEGVYNAKSGHPGGSLSAADLFTYLYFKEMNVDAKKTEGRKQGSLCAFQGALCSRPLCGIGVEGLFPMG